MVYLYLLLEKKINKCNNENMGNTESVVPKLFGENVQRFRKEKNLTQVELAEKIGITQKHLSEIETGIKFPSASIIEELSKSFGKPVSALFGGTDINVYDMSNKVVDLLMMNLQPKLNLIYQELDDINKRISNMKITIQTDIK